MLSLCMFNTHGKALAYEQRELSFEPIAVCPIIVKKNNLSLKNNDKGHASALKQQSSRNNAALDDIQTRQFVIVSISI
jgi:hypothetical protein